MNNTENKQVVLAMFRHNPQLGNYCTLKVVDVVKITKASVFIDYFGSRKRFDFFGNDKDRSKAVYGSTLYRIYAFEAAKLFFDGDKFDGYRISHGKDVLASI